MVSSIVFLTEVPHHACAINSHMSHEYDHGFPRELPGDTTLFSAVARPGTPGEAKESAPDSDYTLLPLPTWLLDY